MNITLGEVNGHPVWLYVNDDGVLVYKPANQCGTCEHWNGDKQETGVCNMRCGLDSDSGMEVIFTEEAKAAATLHHFELVEYVITKRACVCAAWSASREVNEMIGRLNDKTT